MPASPTSTKSGASPDKARPKSKPPTNVALCHHVALIFENMNARRVIPELTAFAIRVARPTKALQALKDSAPTEVDTEHRGSSAVQGGHPRSPGYRPTIRLFFLASFHADIVFGLACLCRIVFRAGLLFLVTLLATVRLFSLHCGDAAKAEQDDDRSGDESHGDRNPTI